MEDDYKNIGGVSHQTLEGLMVFMEVPEGRKELIEYLNALRNENSKTAGRRLKQREFEKKYGKNNGL